MAQYSRAFVFYKENWATFSHLQAFECAGHGWMVRTRTRQVGWLFSDGDHESALQELLRTHLILPNILGDFLAEHLDEIAGGRMFALEKANNSLRPIVIGSLWRRCAARLGVVDVRSNVAGTFVMSQYTNSIQFGGDSDGATRCAQVTQLSAAAWAQNSEENPLVVLQLDIVFEGSEIDLSRERD